MAFRFVAHQLPTLHCPGSSIIIWLIIRHVALARSMGAAPPLLQVDYRTFQAYQRLSQMQVPGGCLVAGKVVQGLDNTKKRASFPESKHRPREPGDIS
jgi:hypothetical protein